MLDNQFPVHINTLPREILALIFSYLSPRDLLNKALVRRLWQSVSNDPALWLNLTHQHFPYLRKKYAGLNKAYSPKALFIEEYQRINASIKYRNEYKSMKPLLLSSLRGDIEKIEESALTDEAKEKLYILASTNGHRRALGKLNSNGKGLAFLTAAEYGYLPAIEMILSQGDQEVEARYKRDALRDAAAYGHHDVVQLLLTQSGQEISVEDKSEVLRIAAAYGHHDVVQLLLTQSGQEISAEDKGLALQLAARESHLNMVQVLLTEAGQEISIHYKGSALMLSAQNGYLNMVQTLLTQVGQQISDYKGCALRNAAHNGHVSVVQILLTQAGQEILAKDKGLALKLAASEGHLGVVQALLTQADQEISINDKSVALIFAAKGKHLDTVSFLLERCRQELLFVALIGALGFMRACKFYTASALEHVYHKLMSHLSPVPAISLPFVTSAANNQPQATMPIALPALPPATFQSSTEQSELQPMPAQEMLTNVAKRKVGEEKTDSERESLDDESPKNKRAKLG